MHTRRSSDVPRLRMNQQILDTWRVLSEGDVAEATYAKFLDFRAKTSKIHNFRIRAPFLTFFISTHGWERTLQLLFRLRWLILTLF